MKNKIKSLRRGITIFLMLFSIGLAGQIPVESLVKKDFKIAKGQRFLNLPVNNKDQLVRATIRLNGVALDQFTINLAKTKPDFWTFFDVTPYQGKTLTLEVANAPQGFQGQAQQNVSTQVNSELTTMRLEMIFADSKFPGQDSLYKEKDRPQVHFTSQRGWVNDPNGLIYYKGEYQLFFQHNPYGWQWGNMHWGHAVSKDLIHWEQLSEALYPVIVEPSTGRGDAAFSGSAVADPTNTAGFRKNGIDPLIAVYTSTGRGECLKISYDAGRTFEEYSGNPILKHVGRDPKVFWYTPSKHWVMVVWDQTSPNKTDREVETNIRQHSIYTSPDLKNWTYQSGIQGFFECPELFELPVSGESISKWVMYDANGRYVVGDFDGKNFKIEQHFTKYENGGGYFYASQTYNDTPDGRRIQIGWGRNITQPGMPFNQPELFPSELKLKRTLNGYRLCPTPIREIISLHKNTQEINDKIVQTGENAGISVNKDTPMHIIAEIERGDAPITFNILGYELKFDNEWTFSTSVADKGGIKIEAPAGPFPLPTTATSVTYVPNSQIFKIEAIVDKNILEFFINDGELYYVTALNGEKNNRIEASIPANQNNRGGIRKFIVKKLEVSELNSIW